MVNNGGQAQQWQGSDQKAVPGKVHSLHMGVNDMNNHNVNGRGGTPLAPVAEGDGPGEEFSSVILSSEAERILDNAKKRLTVRARNWLNCIARETDVFSSWRETLPEPVRRCDLRPCRRQPRLHHSWDLASR